MMRWIAIAALAVVWVLLWGEWSFANVGSGILVATLAVLVSRPHHDRSPVTIRPWPFVVMVGHVVWTMLAANVSLTRSILSPRRHLQTAIIGIELPGCSPAVSATIVDVLSLSPGVMPVELTNDPPMLMIHALYHGEVERVRTDVIELAFLVIRAMGSPEAVAAMTAQRDERRPAGAVR